MSSARRSRVNLVVSGVGDDADPVPIAVDFAHSATVSDLKAALEDLGLFRPSEQSLRQVWTGATFVDAADLAASQLTHGQQLLVDRAAPRSPRAPTLEEDDMVRLVHESGPLLGFAWPFGATTRSYGWLLDRTSSTIAVTDRTAHADIGITFDATSHLLKLRVEADDVVVHVNGRDAGGGAVTIAPGGFVQISGAGLTQPLELRALLRSEHDQIRGINAAVPYRVRPSTDSEGGELEPREFHWKAPQPPRMPKWDWADVGIQEGSMLVIYVMLMVRTGFAWYFLPFLLLPLGRMAYRYRSYRRDCQAQMEEYDEAVAAIDRELGVLDVQVRDEATRLARLNPPLVELHEAARRRDRLLWQRGESSAGGLRIVVGSGLYVSPSRGVIDGAETDPHLAVWRADAETVRTLEQAPIEFNFETSELAVTGPDTEVQGFVADLVLRLAMQYGPGRLGIRALLPTDLYQRQSLRWLGWLPHTQNITDLYTGPAFPAGPQAVRSAVRASIGLVRDAAEADSRLLLLVHESSGVDLGDLAAYQRLAQGRLHIVWLGTSRSRVPALIRSWLELSRSDQAGPSCVGVLQPGDKALMCSVKDPNEATEQARGIAALVDEASATVSQAISPVVPLGAVLERVASGTEASPERELIATLGEDGSGPFELDLVQHGPHVLVAGTTGSGKSELLRSLVLSLANRYSPQAVALLLIDFKGGASLGDLGRLPHAIGSVTNLEAIDVNRVVRFLQAEIERRQTWLARYNGEYRRFYREWRDAREALAPLPRLVVVIDEFAGFVADGESKREQAVLNVAARGRSLGVHLVIATQSPRGVVTAQVRANVNARIALKVLDAAESEQVIDSKEAFAIPLAMPGRAFARVESGQLHQFQSAFTEARLLARSSDAVVDVQPYNPVIREAQTSASAQAAEDLPTDAQVALADLAGLTPASDESQPKLKPSLLGHVARDRAGDRREDATADMRRPVLLGRRDEPHRQAQDQGFVDLGTGGLLISGSAGSGRSHAIAALAIDFLLANGRCELVVVDAGGGDLGALLHNPPLVVDGADRGRIAHILQQLDQEYGERTAPVLVAIDRLDVVQDVLQETSQLARIIAGGARRNIFTVASCDSRLPLEPELRRAFRHRQTLLDEHAGVLKDDSTEDVVTLIAEPTGGAATKALRALESRRRPERSFPPARVYEAVGGWRPIGYPASAHVDQLDGSRGIPIGVDEVRHETVHVTLSEGLAIAGKAESGKTTALLTIGRLVAERIGRKVPVLRRTPMPVELMPWFFDLHAHLMSADLTSGTGGELLAVLDDPALVSLLVLDDVHQVDGTLSALGVDEHRQTELFRAIDRRLAGRTLRVLAAGPIELFLGMRALRVGVDHLSYRQQLISLQPSPSHLMRAWSGITSDALALVTNTSARLYAPGQGAFVSDGTRREVALVAHPEVAAALRRGSTGEGARGLL